MRAILFTQCLQNDFAKPLQRYEPVPNLLHVGYAEARRLSGDHPGESPLNRLIEWASRQAADDLLIVHIRDWHDPEDVRQHEHLGQFGAHCIAGTPGAEYVFHLPPDAANHGREVNAGTLNDFLDTGLAEMLAPFAAQPLPVGLMGVWTEAKIQFLAYELATRYPAWRLGVCSALTASSSRERHFLALDQMARILRVRVLASVGDFMEFLGGSAEDYPLTGLHEKTPTVELAGDLCLRQDDLTLLRYLFRNCRRVEARALDGGFSGNAVLGTRSIDLHGHEQVPHVLKIGPRTAIGQERTSFEQIEDVLGNHAPRITDFADTGERGALKYRYASMSGMATATFQKIYMQGLPLEDVERILREVFVCQLGRLYAAAELESGNLLDYYQFSPRWAAAVRSNVEGLLRGAVADPLRFPGDRTAPDVCRFYEQDLSALDQRRSDSTHFAYVHGDLNGANIIVDGHQNVWIIDFFHTHRGHVLRDLIKFENDLLYIFTPLAGDDDLAEALTISDALLAVDDLACPLPEADDLGLRRPEVRRAWQTLKILRSFYPDLIRTDRDPLQWCIGAMRYAVHTLGFDEPTLLQKQWALYAAGHLGQRIARTIRSQGELRVDWIDPRLTAPGRVGLTLLPGRRDYSRNLSSDIAVLKRDGVTDVLCLLPVAELGQYGVADLLAQYTQAGLSVHHLPVVDQRVCSASEMAEAVRWMQERLAASSRILIHCTGGLGRSGMAAACLLTARGLTLVDAITEVRRARSPRAIETLLQERFVRDFAISSVQPSISAGQQ